VRSIRAGAQQARRRIAKGTTNADLARERFGELGAADLLAQWIDGARDLAAQLGASDPKRRLPWFGPTWACACSPPRGLMETWAHGQEVYDLVRAERRPTDRLRHIAEIGVRTYGWTFVNRKLEVPGPPPYVRLVGAVGRDLGVERAERDERVRGSRGRLLPHGHAGAQRRRYRPRGDRRRARSLDGDRAVLRGRRNRPAQAGRAR
jgi:uncharacterized protein (TIGR03084 family)